MFVIVLCLISVAAAAPSCTDPRTAALRAQPALQHDEVRDEFGQYAFRYVTAEGTIVSQRGRLVPNPNGCGEVLVVEGETSYIGDDGKTYSTKYTAGLDGTHVEGAHLPVPVPLPAEVVPSIPAPKKNPCAEVVTSIPAPRKKPCPEAVTENPAPKKKPCPEAVTEIPAPKKKPCPEAVTEIPVPKKKPCPEAVTEIPVPKKKPCPEAVTEITAPKKNPCAETSIPAPKKNPCSDPCA